MINLSRTLAVSRKEAMQIVRDTRSLYLALGIPVLFLILFGYALSLDVDNIPLAVWDQDRSPDTREFLDRLTASGYFRLVLYTDSYTEMVKAIDKRTANIGIVFPEHFSRDLFRKSGAQVQAIVDGSDSTRAGIALNYVAAIASMYEQDLIKKELARQAVVQVEIPIEPRISLIYNPELRSRINIIPGLIAVIMMVIAALLTSLTIVREWESGTMEQLISTPVKADELILGKLIPYFVLGCIDVVFIYLMGRYWFDVPFRGNLALMFLLSGLFLVGALCLGFFISIAAKTQLAATQFALLGTFLPSFLLSGFVFPIANMPTVIQGITYIIPARYFIVILRGIYLKGIGLEILAMEVVMLAIFCLLTSFIASRRLEKKLQ